MFCKLLVFYSYCCCMVGRNLIKLTHRKLQMPECTKNRFLLLYGSETGQAQAIAEEINEAAPHHDLAPELHCLSLTDKKVRYYRRYDSDQESTLRSKHNNGTEKKQTYSPFPVIDIS